MALVAGDKVESPLLGLSCAVRKESGFTMREIDDESIKAGVAISHVFGACEASCSANNTGVNATAAETAAAVAANQPLSTDAPGPAAGADGEKAAQTKEVEEAAQKIDEAAPGPAAKLASA